MSSRLTVRGKWIAAGHYYALAGRHDLTGITADGVPQRLPLRLIAR
jgi:hypothetical protein